MWDAVRSEWIIILKEIVDASRSKKKISCGFGGLWQPNPLLRANASCNTTRCIYPIVVSSQPHQTLLRCRSSQSIKSITKHSRYMKTLPKVNTRHLWSRIACAFVSVCPIFIYTRNPMNLNPRERCTCLRFFLLLFEAFEFNYDNLIMCIRFLSLLAIFPILVLTFLI